MQKFRIVAFVSEAARSHWSVSLSGRSLIDLVEVATHPEQALSAVKTHGPHLLAIEIQEDAVANKTLEWINSLDRLEDSLQIALIVSEERLRATIATDLKYPIWVYPAENRSLAELLCNSIPDGLSVREREVIRRLALGYTNKEIAAHLDLSVKSVEKYKARSHKKLGLSSRKHLVEYAIALGWMSDRTDIG